MYSHHILETVRLFLETFFLPWTVSATMEFWGVEVKSGESLKVDPGDDKIIHLSNACLGDVTKAKGESVALYVKFGNQKLVLGTLSSDKFPQVSYDLIFEKEFELSHSWKNGSIFFTGFKAQSQSESDNDEDSEDFDEDIPVSAANGKPEFEVKHGVKPDEAKQKKTADPKKNEKAKEKDANGEDEDSSESDSDDDSSEDKPTANGDIESSEGDEDSDEEDEDDDKDEDEDDDDDESDEETPKKIEAGKKRNIDSAKKTTVPVKKTKFVTPQKTDSKNVVHVATPYPSKQAGKAIADNKRQTPKSGGDYSCKPCSSWFAGHLRQKMP
ncbi:histone deacetylase HDT3 isoform X2 [Vigna radiata var. radiata]|uniref:Histone deacetylase HDT3 isoform X2 n=1 Tax=Vigna radiata var. radiata TaxID=3916 RepID=A0A1S3TRJ2_VIGRR|nr:histone deacetylase HDT3 isoform X2 [Vigna radiata var. radiata]